MTLEDHCNLQRVLVRRLREKGYTHVLQNVEYHIPCCAGMMHGEVDVLALSPYGKWHFYEIKSSPHKMFKAKSQYERFRAAHPQYDVRGVYVSPRKVSFL